MQSASSRIPRQHEDAPFQALHRPVDPARVALLQELNPASSKAGQAIRKGMAPTGGLALWDPLYPFWCDN
jgi:hypothetical protein